MSLSVSIRKDYGAFRLDVNFEAGNEILALLGASGCGKSLTLKCVAGIERPDAGRVVLDGRVLFDSEQGIDLTPQERKVGYLFQQYALFPNMTVAGNIAAGLKGGGRSYEPDIVAGYVRMLHLEGLEKARPHQLSGGQQQRVALARILASEPQAILLDEPFSALDSYLKWQLEMELSDVLTTFQGTTLWVSHDRDEVYRNCATVCVMNAGRNDPVTTVPELFRRPRTIGAARLVGCKNFFEARPAEDGQVFLPELGATLQASEPPAGGFTHVGIHARHLRASCPDEPGLACRVARVTEDEDRTIFMLEVEVKDAPQLRMELPRGEVPKKGDRLRVCADPENVLLLNS